MELDDEEEDDYSDYDEGEDEEEDFIHQNLSGEEDLEDLQAYINQQNQEEEGGARKLRKEALNESTADFNKEIRMIN
ncbi:MAG: hypothetical protein ACMG6E_08710 [Candidatus Roizmanbacteria bacterium]